MKEYTIKTVPLVALGASLGLLTACGLEVKGNLSGWDGLTDPDMVTDDGLEVMTDADGLDQAEDPVGEDVEEEFQCIEDPDCDDLNPCNGAETCDPALRVCVDGSVPEDGTVCGTDTERMICLGGECVASECGDGFVDEGGGEFCEPAIDERCQDDCTYPCSIDEDCPDDGEECNGEEYCDTSNYACARRNVPADGAVCDATSPARKICIDETCRESLCGDGFVDEGGGEECEDGNSVPDDGCEPVTCVFSCHGDGDCDDGHLCTNDRCDPSAHVCMYAIAADERTCRAPAGPCDVEETCDGTGPDCPADGLAPATTLCRPSTGPCDLAETCTGTSAACPADLGAPEGTACNDGDPCTYPDECTAEGLCEGSPSGLHDAASLAPGKEHTCVLMATGGVKCWGRNDKGQLGDGTGTDSSVPVDVSGLSSGVVSLCSGEKHTCAVTASGGVKCWGQNDKNQIGDGTATDRNAPVDVTGLTSGVSSVGCGGKHTCAVTAAGGVKCWGQNDRGQIGDGSTTDRSTPVDVSGMSSGMAMVEGGVKHTCAVTAAGGVKCWGQNDRGQIGDDSTTDRLTPVDVSGFATGAAAVSCGEKHSCAVTAAGGVKCWGQNDRGQIGDNSTTDRSVPVDVSGLATGAAAVSCGAKHTCALLTTGGVRCWGLNDAGQLGNGTTTDSLTPINVTGLASSAVDAACGYSHTCAVLDTGAVMCWGKNDRQQLGDGTNTNRSTPVEVSCP